MKYKRILLKLSGEALMGDNSYGIDSKRLQEYATQIKNVHDLGVEIAIVIGEVISLEVYKQAKLE